MGYRSNLQLPFGIDVSEWGEGGAPGVSGGRAARGWLLRTLRPVALRVSRQQGKLRPEVARARRWKCAGVGWALADTKRLMSAASVRGPIAGS